MTPAPLVFTAEQTRLPPNCEWASTSLTWSIYTLLERDFVESPPPMWERDGKDWFTNCDKWLNQFNLQLLFVGTQQHLRGHSILLYKHPRVFHIVQDEQGKEVAMHSLDCAVYYGDTMTGCFNPTSGGVGINRLFILPYDPAPHTVRWRN